MPDLSKHQLKCDARDTTGSTIFFFGGVGDKNPSSVGRAFSGFGFSVSGIAAAPQLYPKVVLPNLDTSSNAEIDCQQ
jgi:hypothetical protein